MYAQEPTNIRRKHTRVYTLHNTTPLTNMRNNASWSFIPSSSFHCACILPLFPSLPDPTCRRRNHCLHKLILQNRHVNRHRLPRSAVPVDGTKCYHRLVCLLSQQLHHFFSLLFLEESAVVAVAVSTAAAVAQMTAARPWQVIVSVCLGSLLDLIYSRRVTPVCFYGPITCSISVVYF